MASNIRHHKIRAKSFFFSCFGSFGKVTAQVYARRFSLKKELPGIKHIEHLRKFIVIYRSIHEHHRCQHLKTCLYCAAAH